MASAVLALRTRIAALLSPPQAAALAVRYASKKTGGSSKNLGGKSPGRRFGLKKMEGHYVHAGNILATQRHFRWHPGAHVSFLRLARMLLTLCTLLPWPRGNPGWKM
uniref:Mitochondrial ribosomal protein L27 n=1 Tax=Equus asinus asinus TaxID=83772 RepID=A0A8C4MLC1_EQUAS